MIIGVDIRFDGAVTGVEEYARRLFLTLLNVDRENKYVFFRSGLKKNADKFWQDLAGEMGQLIELPWPNKLLNICLKTTKLPQFTCATGKLDLFFMPNYNLYSVEEGIKTVMTVHDLSFERFPHFFSLKRKLWHKLIMPRLRTNEIDRIITPSESTKFDLVELYNIDPDKISIIRYGIRPIFRFPINDDVYLENIKRKYSLPKKFILSLSTLEPRKNLRTLIESFQIIKKENKDIGLVLAGMQGWLYRDLIKDISKERVQCLGFVDDSDKPALYSLASVFVYPSFFEGFGFPPLEAMASGIPVVVADTSSLPESIQGAALMVNPLRVSELAWAINEILNNEVFKKRLILKGLNIAKQFSWQKTAEETLVVWEKIVS